MFIFAGYKSDFHPRTLRSCASCIKRFRKEQTCKDFSACRCSPDIAAHCPEPRCPEPSYPCPATSLFELNAARCVQNVRLTFVVLLSQNPAVRAQQFWHTSSCSGKFHLTLCLAPPLSTLFCHMYSSKAWPLKCFSFPGKLLSLLNWFRSWSIACGISVYGICMQFVDTGCFAVLLVNWHIVSNPQGIMSAMCSSFALSMDLFPDLAECVADCAAGLSMVCLVACDFGPTLSFTSLRDA